MLLHVFYCPLIDLTRRVILCWSIAPLELIDLCFYPEKLFCGLIEYIHTEVNNTFSSNGFIILAILTEFYNLLCFSSCQFVKDLDKRLECWNFTISHLSCYAFFLLSFLKLLGLLVCLFIQFYGIIKFFLSVFKLMKKDLCLVIITLFFTLLFKLLDLGLCGNQVILQFFNLFCCHHIFTLLIFVFFFFHHSRLYCPETVLFKFFRVFLSEP